MYFTRQGKYSWNDFVTAVHWEKIYTTDSFEKIHAQYNTKSKLSIFKVKLCTQKLPNWNKACEMWKTVFGYKMNSTLLTDASLQSIKLIQAYVFHMYIIFRVMLTLLSHWFPLKPSPTSKLLNQTTSRSCTTTLQVYKIHTTAFIKNVIYLCLFSGYSRDLVIALWGLEFISQLSLHLQSHLIY